ncbi:terminase family protein [Ferrovibrio sp.]|uniref:terminase large subunit domain-containing protein n=1 Tax=Ferrovibrio sp. TaxID=1917215 RepID=UPI000CAFCB5A|nr:terminase family protein [Ferrovibrio sp.]PJI40402.1 MAG: hypothetical protein CTR53_10350 [Ferrovibrio sp.]
MEDHIATERGTGEPNTEPEYSSPYGTALELWRNGADENLTDEKRLIAGELIRRGEFTWLLHPGQLKLYDALQSSNSLTHVLNISRQFGKSFLMVLLCLIYCLRHPGSKIYYAAPTKEQVKIIVKDNINKILRYFPKDLAPKKAYDTWTFKNGSEFRLIGLNMNDGVGVRGGSAHIAVLDECRDMPNLEYIIDSNIRPMFSTTNGKLFLISTPPDSPGHAFTAKYIAEGIAGGYYHHATYKDNPRTSPQFIESVIKSFPDGENSPGYKREYLADYTIANENTKVVSEWNAVKNDELLSTWKGFPDRFRPLLGMDIGFNDNTAIVVGGYDWSTGTVVITHEAVLKNAITTTIGEKIGELQKDFLAKHPSAANDTWAMYSDNDPRLLEELFLSYGIKIAKAHKKDKHASLNNLKVYLGLHKLLIVPECKQLRFQLETGVWNKSRNDYVRNDAVGHLDAMEACKYLVNSMNWNEALYRKIELAPNQRLTPVGKEQMKGKAWHPMDMFGR